MPTLNWIGKDKVVDYHHKVPYCTLEKKYAYGDEDSGNMIIHGDNLLALKSLLPQYEGKIKCIYIDPPYNTGNEKWVYNDNVNSDKIRKWLGEVVGKEGEDLSRHDKWLCMMYPRLQLLKQLLSEDGAIFISIDDNEQANLKLLCDEVFGARNFIGQFSWVRKKKGSFLSKTLRKMVEYVLCYQKTDDGKTLYGEKAYSNKWQPIVKRTNSKKTLFIPSHIVKTTLEDGIYDEGRRGKEGTGVCFNKSFEVENGLIKTDVTVTGRFVWTQEYLENEISQGTEFALSNKFGFNVLRYNQEEKVKTPSTLINESNGVGTNEDASSDLQNIFNSGLNEVFQYSKPHNLIEYLINMICHREDSIILDSFAGSGTTGHAVLNLNKNDGGKRKFILVEMEDYADTITAERVKRVIDGYGEGTKKTEGTGGGFVYYELGDKLMVDGYINEKQPIEKIREYIWYTETHTAICTEKVDGYYLGEYEGAGYYFYYEKEGVTTLSYETLNEIVKTKAEMYVIYADKCTIDKEDLKSMGIVFKKIPRDIRQF